MCQLCTKKLLNFTLASKYSEKQDFSQTSSKQKTCFGFTMVDNNPFHFQEIIYSQYDDWNGMPLKYIHVAHCGLQNQNFIALYRGFRLHRLGIYMMLGHNDLISPTQCVFPLYREKISLYTNAICGRKWYPMDVGHIRNTRSNYCGCLSLRRGDKKLVLVLVLRSNNKFPDNGDWRSWLCYYNLVGKTITACFLCCQAVQSRLRNINATN